MKIKALEWHRFDDGTESASGVVTYYVGEKEGGGFWACTPPTDDYFGSDYGVFNTIEDAKAACQSDHEKSVSQFLEADV